MPERLRGDAARLAQCLINLLSNAIKFTDRGTVSLHCRQTAEHGDRLRLRFEVQDTDIGVAPDRLAELFDASTQVDTSLTRRQGGSGLGLALTRQLATCMGGEAGADSQPGQGSTFWIKAWLGRGSGETQPQVSTEAARAYLLRRLAGQRVLLGEDNAVNQEVASELLSSAGLQVSLAEDVMQAVARLQREPFELVLMEVQMPGTTRTSTINRLSNRHRHRACGDASHCRLLSFR